MSEIDKDLDLGEEEEQNETGNEEKEQGGEESKPESKPRLTKEQKLGLLKRQVTKLEKDLGVGELTFVYCQDPEGNIIEIQHWKK